MLLGILAKMIFIDLLSSMLSKNWSNVLGDFEGFLRAKATMIMDKVTSVLIEEIADKVMEED